MTATDKNDIQGDFCSMLFCVLSRSDRRLSDGRLTLLFGRPVARYYVKKHPLEGLAFSGCCDKGPGVFRRSFLMVDAYVGLSADHMLIFGAAGTVLILCVYAVICYFAGAYFIRKGVYTLSEKESAVYHRNHRLKRNCAVVALAFYMFARRRPRCFFTSKKERSDDMGC